MVVVIIERGSVVIKLVEYHGRNQILQKQADTGRRRAGERKERTHMMQQMRKGRKITSLTTGRLEYRTSHGAW
jgi:hypothetical protein